MYVCVYIYIYNLYIHARDIFQPTASHHGFQEEHDLPNNQFLLDFPIYPTDPFAVAAGRKGGQLISQRAALQTHPEAAGGHRRRAWGPRPWSLSSAESGLHPVEVASRRAGGSRCASKRCMGLPIFFGDFPLACLITEGVPQPVESMDPNTWNRHLKSFESILNPAKKYTRYCLRR